jgi:hypothetical protein
MMHRREFLQFIPAAAALGAAGHVSAEEQSQAPAATAKGGATTRADLLRSRAIEAMIWGMPAVNLDLMDQAMLRETPGRANQLLYWSSLLDWKNQTLTPNTDVIYLTPYFDTKVVGPMVLEIPPADDGVINGTIMDAWQLPLEDVGPAGADRGQGGRYVILPPDYDTNSVPQGFTVLPSQTYRGYALLRSILRSGSEADLAKAVDYGRRIKVYPLSQAASPPPTTYVDAAGVLYDATIPYDPRFYAMLDRHVQYEPWLPRDRAMVDTLRMIGIEKGKPYTPDAARRKVLDDAAADAYVVLDSWYAKVFETHFVPGSRWVFPADRALVESLQSHFADPNVYPVDSRGLLFTYVFFTPKRLGEGQFYLMVLDDKDGHALDGGESYRLKVPADAPVRQYWSVTVYDRRTHALIREMPLTGRSSQSPGLQVNADGTVDLYFGPAAPAGRESNWIPTRAKARYEAMIRFFGPTPALFNKSWVLPDIVRSA